MNTTSTLSSLFALVAMFLLASCGSSTPSPLRDYSDAVTNINQVDARYRPYFRAQNGSNYSLADQRKAYVAALQTARTPVGRMSLPSRATSSRSRIASRSSKASRGRHIAARGKKATRNTGRAAGRRVASTRKAARRSSRRRG